MISSDCLRIQQFTADTTLGVHDWERRIRTKILLDISLYFDTRKAARFDDLTATLNYETLIQDLKLWLKQQNDHLLETLCEKTSQYLMAHYPIIHELSLTIAKPGVLEDVQSIGLTIHRKRQEELKEDLS